MLTSRPVRRRSMTSSPMIEAQGLTKRFGSTLALDGLDLAVPPGTILGVLGPNGAGKTTAVRILTTLPCPTAAAPASPAIDVVGEARWRCALIGVTGQDATLDEVLTGRQNLVMVGRLSGLRRGRGARPGAASCSSGSTSPTPPTAIAEGLLGRHAPPARPRRQPRDPAAGAVPRRAHHRPRPHQPRCACGTSSASSSRDGTTRAAHHPVPRRGRPARRPDRRSIDHGRVDRRAAPRPS